MLIKYVFAVFVLLAGLWAVAVPDMAMTDEINRFKEKRLLVQFIPEAKQEEIDNLLKIHGLSIETRIEKIKIYQLSFPSINDIGKTIDSLENSEIVLFCEPDCLSEIHQAPNDSLFSQQWGLNNIGASGADIQILEAWDLEPGDPDVVVAIIDMGFDVSHSDLQSNIWNNPGEIPDNGVDDDQNGYVDDIIGWDFVNQSQGYDDPSNDWKGEDNDPTLTKSTHGNEVFGVIGATTNNSIGIAGITGRCKMMLIRAGYLNTEGKAVLSGAHIAKGIIYATNNGASVINISSGSNTYSNSYRAALQYAINNGLVITCSAGNEGSNTPVYPAAYDLNGLISVGASTKEDKLARFSNWGDWVDVSAPGQHIISTLNNDQYGQVQGTSFAAPVVAGIAALLVSRYPGWTPAQIHNQIMATVDVSEFLRDANITSGRVNAYKALLNTGTDTQTAVSNDNTAKDADTAPPPAAAASDDGGSGCFISISREELPVRFSLKGVFL